MYCVVMLFTTFTLFVFCRTMNTFLIVFLIVLVSQGALCAGLMFWKQGTKSGVPSYVYLEKPKVTVSELSSLVSLFLNVGHDSFFLKKDRYNYTADRKGHQKWLKAKVIKVYNFFFISFCEILKINSTV